MDQGIKRNISSVAGWAKAKSVGSTYKWSPANVVVIMQLYILNTLNHPSRILPESIGLEFLLFYLESLGQLRGERNTFVTQEIERDCVIHERMDSMLKTYSELQCLQFNYKELTTV